MNDSEVAAECLGVDTFALRLRVFVLAAGYAGLAGVFYAHWLGVVSPEAAGFELSVELLLMVVLGGLGSVGCADRRHRRQRHGRGGEDLITALIPGASGEVRCSHSASSSSSSSFSCQAASPSSGTTTAPRTARSTGAAARTADSTESTPSSSVQHTPTTGSRLAGLLEGADLPERGSPAGRAGPDEAVRRRHRTRPRRPRRRGGRNRRAHRAPTARARRRRSTSSAGCCRPHRGR